MEMGIYHETKKWVGQYTLNQVVKSIYGRVMTLSESSHLIVYFTMCL